MDRRPGAKTNEGRTDGQTHGERPSACEARTGPHPRTRARMLPLQKVGINHGTQGPDSGANNFGLENGLENGSRLRLRLKPFLKPFSKPNVLHQNQGPAQCWPIRDSPRAKHLKLHLKERRKGGRKEETQEDNKSLLCRVGSRKGEREREREEDEREREEDGMDHLLFSTQQRKNSKYC